MANENLEDWKMKPSVYNETILCAKEFLDKELARFDSWNLADPGIRQIFDTVRSFTNSKRDGVGRRAIKKCLGGSWGTKSRIVQDTLNTFDETKAGKIDAKVIDELTKEALCINNR
jgi:hypothetical protein